MTPVEAVRRALFEIEINERHGVIPVRLAQQLVYHLTIDLIDLTDEQMVEIHKEVFKP